LLQDHKIQYNMHSTWYILLLLLALARYVFFYHGMFFFTSPVSMLYMAGNKHRVVLSWAIFDHSSTKIVGGTTSCRKWKWSNTIDPFMPIMWNIQMVKGEDAVALRGIFFFPRGCTSHQEKYISKTKLSPEVNDQFQKACQRTKMNRKCAQRNVYDRMADRICWSLWRQIAFWRCWWRNWNSFAFWEEMHGASWVLWVCR
jgi:hypothetical protein